jgi:hypothetical protein
MLKAQMVEAKLDTLSAGCSHMSGIWRKKTPRQTLPLHFYGEVVSNTGSLTYWKGFYHCAMSVLLLQAKLATKIKNGKTFIHMSCNKYEL